MVLLVVLTRRRSFIIQHSLQLTDPLWEKVQLGGKYIIEIWAEIAKNATVLANLVFVTGESYGLASTVSRWSGVNTLFLALVASLQSCGRRLEIYCVIEIPRAISRNSACGRSRTFTHIVRERKGLRTCGFRHRMQQALRFRMIFVTQFRIFPPSGTFSQSGSPIHKVEKVYNDSILVPLVKVSFFIRSSREKMTANLAADIAANFTVMNMRIQDKMKD